MCTATGLTLVMLKTTESALGQCMHSVPACTPMACEIKILIIYIQVMLPGCFDSIASVTTSSKKVSSIEVPLISLVVAITKSLLTSGLVLRNLRAPISAKVTPPMNMTRTTLRFLSLAPA